MRRDRGGFAAQHARPEAAGAPAGRDRRKPFGFLQPAFRTDQQRNRCRTLRHGRERDLRLGREQEPRAVGRRIRQERLERARLGDGGNPRAAALLAGGDGDALPVRALARAGGGVEAHDAARRRDRHDRRDAELGRLLHDEIHALRARDALHQRDGERRFGAGGDTVGHLGLRGRRGRRPRSATGNLRRRR